MVLGILGTARSLRLANVRMMSVALRTFMSAMRVDMMLFMCLEMSPYDLCFSGFLGLLCFCFMLLFFVFLVRTRSHYAEFECFFAQRRIWIQSVPNLTKSENPDLSRPGQVSGCPGVQDLSSGCPGIQVLVSKAGLYFLFLPEITPSLF